MNDGKHRGRFEGDGLATGSCLRLGPGGRVAAALLLAVAGWLSLSAMSPPDSLNGASQGFRMERAQADLEAVAGEPRPLGSEAHARVRQYLLDEIRAAGLQAEVQEAVVHSGDPPGVHRLTRVRNVIGRLEGSSDEPAILLATHYDSVPAAPGAGDAGAGMAALLETLRVMGAERPPRRDVIFLFTDGEESGLLGARAFVDAGRADDIAWVVNFEARGAAGASLMFETMPGDPEAIRFLNQVSPRAVAASYSYDIYRRMPNDTDFSVFRRVVPAGFNFAFIEDPAAYHSVVDTPQRLDDGSLFHHGVQALALGRELAGGPPGPGGERAVYFNVPLAGLVIYPAQLDGWAALICGVLGLAVLVVGSIRRALTPGRLLLGLLAITATMALAVLGLSGLRWLWVEVFGLARDTRGVLAPLGYGWLLVGVGLASTGLVLLVRRLGALNLAAAAAVIWTALAAGSALKLGSSAFLFTWPVLFVWTGLLLAVTAGESARDWRGAVVLACAVPAIVIWVPTLKVVALALGPAAMILGVCASLPVVLLGLQASQLSGPGLGRWWIPVLSLALGLALFGWAAMTAGPSPSHPRANSLVYTLDATSGEAAWASYDEAPDDWTSRALGDSPERRTMPGFFFTEDLELMTASTEPLPLPPPSATVIEDEALNGGGRRLSIELGSPRGAPFLELRVNAGGAVRAAAVDGRELEVDGPFLLSYQGLPPDGVTLHLELTQAAPVTLSVVDGSHGLPDAVAPRARPSWYEPRRFPWAVHERRYPFSDTTLVRSETTIP